MDAANPGKQHFRRTTRGDFLVFDPGKCCFLPFARGDHTHSNPDYIQKTPFARGVKAPLTLANNIFGALPGVVSWCATLANDFFYRLPGANGRR